MKYLDMNEESKVYIMVKGLSSIMFSNDYRLAYEIVNDTVGFEDYKMILLLKQLVNNYRYILDRDMKENISNLINHYRYDLVYINDEARETVFNDLNEIIHIMNSTDRNTKEINKFIDDESELRGIYSPIISDGTLDNEVSKIKRYNEMDYLVLCLLTGMIEPEYEQNVIETFSEESQAFMYSINVIAEEWPDIINDEFALDRIKRVNNLLKGKIDELEELDKKILKKEYKTYSKKVNKIYNDKVIV